MKRPLLGVLVMLAIAWGGVAALLATDTLPKLGLDLQGGISVVLTAPEGTDPEVLEVAGDIIRRRIEQIGGVQEPDIAPSPGTAFRPPSILVQLPGVTDEERALEAVGTTGALTFRPVLGAVLGSTGPLADGGEIPATDLTPEAYERCYALEGAPEPSGAVAPVDPATGLTIEDDPTAETFLEDEGTVLHLGPAVVSGTDIRGSVPQFADQWLVTLDFTTSGDDRFACLTGEASRYQGAQRQIAIVLDGEVTTAPPVAPDVGTDGIRGGAVIRIGADQEAQQEASDLSVVLRYGSLPVSFELSDISQVSGTLGADSLRIGLFAGIAGLVLVAAFLVVFYRALGLVAIVGLTVFGSFLLVIFALLGTRGAGLTLTLAGVTGVIVAIGITADSYIVYFERIKEEIRSGVSVGAATRDGFKSAFRTILTADTVSLLAAGLLYVLAVGPVKGFALSLGIATILDIVVARGYTRRAAAVLAEGRLGEGGWFSIAGAAGKESTS